MSSSSWSIRSLVGNSPATIVGVGFVLYELRDNTTRQVRSYSIGGISAGLSLSSAMASMDQTTWSEFETAGSHDFADFDYALTTVKSAVVAGVAGYCRCTFEWLQIQRKVGFFGRLWHGVTQVMLPLDHLVRSGDEVDVSGFVYGVGAGISSVLGPSIPMGKR